MEVPKLKVLCMAKITTHIWSINDPIQLSIDYPIEFAFVYLERVRYTPWEIIQSTHRHNTEPTPLVQQLNGIMEKITGLTHVPKQLRLQISISYLHLVIDVIDWCSVLQKGVASYYSIWYFMEKTIFTSVGKVDRSFTVLRVLFDTYGDIDIRLNFMKYCCFLLPSMVDDYVKIYITNKSLKKRIKKKVTKMKIKDNDEPEYYRMKISVNGVVELLQFYHNTIEDSKKTMWLCELASHISQPKNTIYYIDKIIYIYHHIDYGTWLKFLKKEYMTVITEFFHDGPSEYCLLFYTQIIQCKPDKSIHILKELLTEINAVRYKFCYNTFKEYQKDIMVRIWASTPSEAKSILMKKPYFYERIGYMFCNFHSYDIISTFIKDSVHSEEDRKDLINLLMLIHKSRDSDCDYKSHLDNLYVDFNVAGPNYEQAALKRFFIKGSQKLFGLNRIDKIFENKEQMNSFKEKISNDYKFMTEVISNFCTDFLLASTVSDFLLWCFEDKDSAIKFVKEHLIQSDLMIHIYCDYLYGLAWTHRNDKRIFNQIFNNESVQLACELRVKMNDPIFFYKTLNLILMKKNHKSLLNYLKNIYDEIEIKNIVESYLLSESGLKDILSVFIHSEYASTSFVFEYKVKDTLKENIKFKKYWLKHFELLEPFNRYMLENSKMVYQKHFKSPLECDMLPYESTEQHKTIVNARYKIFMSMMQKNVSDALIDELLSSPFIVSLSHIAEHVSGDLHIADLISDM